MAFEKISPVEVGDADYTMMSAALANRVINGVNAANSIEFIGIENVRVDASNEKITVDMGGGMKPLKDMIVVLNGTAYYTNILTDGRLEEIP